MQSVFLSTLGQRPEAITVAFDILRDRYAYAEFGVLHTDPHLSGIARAYEHLHLVLARDYPAVKARFHKLQRPDGSALIDIVDDATARAYHRAVLTVLHEYRERGFRIHLLVSSGRKAMSVYAMLAASILFDPPHDKVWVVLSPDAVVARAGEFHVPTGMRPEIEIVDLPLITARLAPGTHPFDYTALAASRAEQFLAKLSTEERAVALMLKSNPYASNPDLAQMMTKAPKTIEHQLASIYDKLIGFLDHGETIDPRKRRQALLDLLNR